jgi:hypothetical protein
MQETVAQVVGTTAFVLFLLFGVILYLLPFWLALYRRHPHAGGIFWTNILLGWTFVIWAWTLVWALGGVQIDRYPAPNTSSRSHN